MNPEQPILLELNDVTVPSRRDGETASIEHVNWTVRAGEFWMVGGYQGAGKSDLIFLLAGITRPMNGCYRLFDHDMGQLVGDEFLPNRRRMGMVFDDARLLNHLTISENVSLPVRYHENVSLDEAEEWVGALMHAVEITEFALEMPSSISRSWRRRAALARALALRPEILFLENPLRGLDTRHSFWWRKFIERLWRGDGLMGGKAMTVIAVDDEFRPWRRLATRFALLRQNDLVVMGETAPEDEDSFLREHAAREI